MNLWRQMRCAAVPLFFFAHRLSPFVSRTAMGQDPSDEELFDMIAAVDDDGSAEIGAHVISAPPPRSFALPSARSNPRRLLLLLSSLAR